MTYDEFMQRPQVLHNRIMHQIEETQRLEMLCNRTTPTISEVHVQMSKGNQREKWLAAYIDSKHKINALMAEYDEAAESVRTWLYDNLDFDDADILEYRYCGCLRNDEIADRLNYRPTTMRKKISRAVRLAKDKYYQE